VQYVVKLRYYPGDPLKEIREGDLRGVSQEWGLEIQLEQVHGEVNGTWEETLDTDLESITQTVITVFGDDASSLEHGLKDLIAIYRAPRTVFALWGSNPAGEAIAWKAIDEMDGWR